MSVSLDTKEGVGSCVKEERKDLSFLLSSWKKTEEGSVLRGDIFNQMLDPSCCYPEGITARFYWVVVLGMISKDSKGWDSMFNYVIMDRIKHHYSKPSFLFPESAEAYKNKYDNLQSKYVVFMSFNGDVKLREKSFRSLLIALNDFNDLCIWSHSISFESSENIVFNKSFKSWLIKPEDSQDKDVLFYNLMDNVTTFAEAYNVLIKTLPGSEEWTCIFEKSLFLIETYNDAECLFLLTEVNSIESLKVFRVMFSLTKTFKEKIDSMTQLMSDSSLVYVCFWDVYDLVKTQGDALRLFVAVEPEHNPAEGKKSLELALALSKTLTDYIEVYKDLITWRIDSLSLRKKVFNHIIRSINSYSDLIYAEKMLLDDEFGHYYLFKDTFEADIYFNLKKQKIVEFSKLKDDVIDFVGQKYYDCNLKKFNDAEIKWMNIYNKKTRADLKIVAITRSAACITILERKLKEIRKNFN